MLRELKFFREPRADQCSVIPGNFGDWTRELLQPAIVGVASVVNVRIRAKNKFKLSRGNRLRGRQTCGAKLRRNGYRRVRGVGNHSVIQSLPPELLRIAAASRGFKAVANRVISLQARLVCEG